MSNQIYGSSSATDYSVPFDNTGNAAGFNSTNVHDAIVEASTRLVTTEVSSVAAATAGTGADALMTGMTITPVSGTYLVWFSCDLNSATAGVVVSVSYYIGGTQKADSLRKVMPFAGGTLTSGSQRVAVALNGQVSVNGSQAIEVRWSASAGAPTTAARTLNILRIL